MLLALRSLRSAASEFFFDLPRMVLLNIFWVLTALPAIATGFLTYLLVWPDPGRPPVLHIWLVPMWVLALALAGPGTAGIYYVTNRLANGELLEITRFVEGFRHFFWRGWGMALLDVGALAILLINVIFYWSLEGTGPKLLSLVFGYLLLIWLAIQGYLFSFMVELDQGVLRATRNALFLTIDDIGLTLGLLVVNLVFTAASSPFTAGVALFFVTMSLASNVHNKVIVDTVARYRVQGRVFTDEVKSQ